MLQSQIAHNLVPLTTRRSVRRGPRVRQAAEDPAFIRNRSLSHRGGAAAPPPDMPAIPPGGQVIQLKAGEDLREQLEKLGVSEEQIEKIEKQIPSQGKAKGKKQ